LTPTHQNTFESNSRFRASNPSSIDTIAYLDKVALD
jgi:hypothetical protein